MNLMIWEPDTGQDGENAIISNKRDNNRDLGNKS